MTGDVAKRVTYSACVKAYQPLISDEPETAVNCLPASRTSPTPPADRGLAMLSIQGRGAKLCDGITRREMLRVGALGFAGLTLADVLRLRAASPTQTERAKSVIMIWLRG